MKLLFLQIGRCASSEPGIGRSRSVHLHAQINMIAAFYRGLCVVAVRTGSNSFDTNTHTPRVRAGPLRDAELPLQAGRAGGPWRREPSNVLASACSRQQTIGAEQRLRVLGRLSLRQSGNLGDAVTLNPPISKCGSCDEWNLYV
eukprot:6207466-Pleurochrysis_carterae.AAC.1